jgi:RNA polymerase subunit RPABC4/transcription elongation factor Spt4
MNSFDYSVLIYPALLLIGLVLAVVDLWIIFARVYRVICQGLEKFLSHRRAMAAAKAAAASGAYVPPEKETCPTCGADLVDGECPQGHTIVRCSKCSAIMKDGVCPRCGVGGEQEFCPTCNSELVDGECPRGHTIVRCPDCGSILSEGVCPKGCNADPLNLGWPGGVEKKLGNFALQVVACPKSEGAGFTLRIPNSFVMGRSATDAKEPFVELLTITRKEKAQCSRQYVRMDLDPDGAAFTVTLLNSSRNPAFVDNKKIAIKDEKAKLGLGGHIKLNPGYELELVEAPADAPAAETPVPPPAEAPVESLETNDDATTVKTV